MNHCYLFTLIISFIIWFSFLALIVNCSDDIDGYEGRYCIAVNRTDIPEPCRDIVTDFVAVKSLQDYQDQIKDVSDYINTVTSILPDDNSTLGRCKQPLLTSICFDQLFSNCKGDDCSDVAKLFRPCIVDPISGEPLVPATEWPVCLDYCTMLYEGCYDLFDGAGILDWFIPCSEFSDNSTILKVGSAEFELPCLNYSRVNYTGDFTACPEDTTLDAGACQPSCPSPIFSREMYSNFSLMQQIVGWLSFCFAGVLIILYLFHPRHRLFPSNIVMYLGIATMPLSLGFMLPSFVDSIDDVLCGNVKTWEITVVDNPGESVANGGLCQFQGWLILYGSLSTAIWWALYGVNTLYVTLQSRMFKRGGRKDSIIQEVIYHLVGWGIPLIMCIIAIATDNLEYNLGYSYCFITSADNHGWMIGLWLVPIALCLLFGGISVVVSMVMINKMLNQISRKSHKKFDQILMIVRTLAFLVLFWYFYTFVFAQLIWQEAHRSQNEEDLVEYYFCLFKTFNVTDISQYCRDTYLRNNEEQYNLQMVANFNLACQGVILALIFLVWSKVISYALFRAHIVDTYSQTGFSKSREKNSSQVELNHVSASSA